MGWAAAAVAVAGSLVDTYEQNRNADIQEDFLQRRFNATRAAAVESFQVQSADVRVRTAQERQQVAAEIENLTAEALTRRGAASASAVTAGVSGQSVADAQLDVMRAEGATRGRLNTLQDFREAAAELRLRNLRIQTRNRILGALPPPVIRPSFLSGLFGAFSSGAQGYAAGQELSKAQ